MYICEIDGFLRRISMQGDVTTFANIGPSPTGIVVSHKDNCLYVSSFYSICRINFSSGVASKFVGLSEERGNMDGNGQKARFGCIQAITIDQESGNVFVCDEGNHSIRKVTPQGQVSTLAGSRGGFSNGNGKIAKFYYPYSIFYDQPSQSLLVCDAGNNKVRKVLLNGDVTTLFEISHPVSVAVTSNNIIFICSFDKIYKATQSELLLYTVDILKGHKYSLPYGIAVHEASHSCFVVESGSNSIKKITFK